MEIPSHQIIQINELFTMLGYRRPSMDDISKHLSISKKTLYKYVLNKNELVEKLLNNQLKKLEERYEEINAKPISAKEQFEQLTQLTQEVYLTINNKMNADLHRYYFNALKDFQAFEQQIATHFETCINKGIILKEFRQPKAIRIFITLYLNNLKAITFKQIDYGDYSLQDFTIQLLENQINALEK